jgi:cytochrome c551/c552
LPADIDTLEEAIGHLLVGRGLNDVAKEYGIDRGELRRLADAYKKAGRGVLGGS